MTIYDNSHYSVMKIMLHLMTIPVPSMIMLYLMKATLVTNAMILLSLLLMSMIMIIKSRMMTAVD